MDNTRIEKIIKTSPRDATAVIVFELLVEAKWASGKLPKKRKIAQRQSNHAEAGSPVRGRVK